LGQQVAAQKLPSRPQEHFDVWWKGIGNLIAQAELLQIGKSMKMLIIFMENSIKMWMITLRGTPMTLESSKYV
jgi:hypothetical protein